MKTISQKDRGHKSIIAPWLSVVSQQLSSWCGWPRWNASSSVLPSIGCFPRVLQTAPGSAAPPARPPCWAEAGGWVRSLPVLGLRTVVHRDNSLHGLLTKYKCYDAATVGCDGDFQKDAACLCASQGQSLVSWLAKKSAKVRTSQVNSPSCLSRPVTCSRRRSMWSKEHLRLCTTAAKFIIPVVGTLSFLTTCQTAHGHGDEHVIKQRQAQSSLCFDVVQAHSHILPSTVSTYKEHDIVCKLRLLLPLLLLLLLLFLYILFSFLMTYRFDEDFFFLPSYCYTPFQ